MTLQKYEWQQICLTYIQGRENGDGMLEWPTLEQLAQDYSIPLPTIKSHSSRENWGEERNLFHTQLIQKSREKTLEQLAEKASQLDVQAFVVARASLALLARQLIEGTQDGSLSLAEQALLVKMCDIAHRLGRRALGQGEA